MASAIAAARPAAHPQSRAAQPLLASLLVLIPLVFTAAVYYPITQNYFFVDDFINLYRIVNEALPTYVLRPHGGHLLVVRNTFFFAFAQVFGTNAALFFWAVLATHLVNVALVFLLVRRLTGSLLLGCFGATLWGISPMNQGSLGWYSVYGQVVATTFILVILCQMARAVETGREPSRATRRLWYVLAIAAVTSFGTAITVAMALPIVAWLLLGPSRPWWRTPLLGLLVIVPALYVSLPWLFVQMTGESPGLESGVIANWDTWGHSPELLYHLIAYGMAQFVAGTFYTAAQYPDLLSDLVAGGGAAVVVIGFVLAQPATRRRVLAFAILIVAAYTSIAMARAVFFFAQGLAHFATGPRYHYVPSAFLAVSFCLLLGDLGPRLTDSALVKAGALTIWLAWACFSVIAAPLQIDHHDRDRNEVRQALRAVRITSHQKPVGSDVYIVNRHFRPMGFIFPQTEFPGWGGVFAIFYSTNDVDGRRVYFVSKNPKVLAATKDGRRTRDLFVSEVPPQATDRPAPSSQPDAPKPGSTSSVQ